LGECRGYLPTDYSLYISPVRTNETTMAKEKTDSVEVVEEAVEAPVSKSQKRAELEAVFEAYRKSNPAKAATKEAEFARKLAELG